MKTTINARNFDIEERFSKYVQPRIDNLAQYSDRLNEVRVITSLQRGRYTVEITCNDNGMVLRSEVRDGDLLAAFDQALDKVERQLVRYKDKMRERYRRGSHRQAAEEQVIVQADAEMQPQSDDLIVDEEDNILIVRTKTHAVKPMTPEEAVLQMEMVGHDFFVFQNGSANNVGVVYRRRDGGYGLIEPELG